MNNWTLTFKSIAATAVLMLNVGTAQAGLLDLSAPVASYNDQTAPALSANSALLSASSYVSYNVVGLTSFDWLFDAEDYLPFNDYAYFNAGSNVILSNVASVGDYGASGWQTYNFGSAYTGLITFGVYNTLDTSLDSTLAIKNGVNVPEPGTLALFGLGLIGLAFRARKSA